MLGPQKRASGLIVSCLALGVISSAIPPGPSRTSAPAQVETEITRIVEDVIERQRLVGTQVAVWHGGLIVDTSWGHASAALQTPVTASTRFFIASITKSMTALIVSRLAGEGRLDLDASIQMYVPDFPTKPGPAITARLLLDHRGGIRHYDPSELRDGGFFDTHYETAVDALEKFADDPLVAPPGTRVRYSSFGYTLLAAAVESVVDEPFRAHRRRTLFDPLDMADTEAPDWRFPVRGLAPSYAFFLPHLGTASDRPFEARRLNFSYNAGGGNLVSTARDLVTYGRQYLPGGQVSRDYVEEIIDVSSTPSDRLGWHVTRDEGDRTLMHAVGASEAYQGAITIWPAHDLVVVGLSNTWGIGSRQGGFTLEMHKDIGEAVLSR